MRLAIVDNDQCNPETCGGFLCARVCPVNRAKKACITQNSEINRPQINEDLCIGCGICVNKCPVDAITIINLAEELKDDLLHRYGENGFALYRGPIPIKNQVVGLLGQNGTGKTTALQILSGDLKPNLGAETEATKEQLKEFFKGSEMQDYFENIEQKKMSYKPQYVDRIPKMFKGKVKDLLKKSDERKIYDKMVKELGMEAFLENDITEISGGELQKTAIAAAIMKNADIYFFDEPSSYLDVKERLKIARAIQELAKEKLVMVVEHDLVVLDYLTDLVHVFYGKPAAYGIVSFPKAARNGINAYLEGFLKEENVRFRETPIKFIVKGAEKGKKLNPIVNFEGLSKKFDNFELTVEKGEIHEKEIVGVLGPNATGKTTFMKMLAGELKSDSGNLSKEIKISYKPQYIKPEDDLFVRVALAKTPQKLIADLSLEKLLEKKLGQLSGGELQRVAIARCLSQEADLYLLDEPSAHLDVEQRVNVADILKRDISTREKSAIVIDHDIMFLDYLSDRLMTFLGEPGKKGEGKGPYAMEEGMNLFLKDLDITFRRDPDTGRPRSNKPDSVKDREQKKSGNWYYVK
ncbi:MAG: ribosome biogenesis/translation initiation ATPase RLI [archaeon]